MTRRRGVLLVACCLLCCGCSHFAEGRAITAFTRAMTDGDLAELRELTSDQFEQKALRRAEALDDLQVLRLPQEPPSIVEVKDVSASEKHVTVTTAEGGTRLLYRLVQDRTSRRWVVDDIYTRQTKSGVKVTKPITEQMDLLLTIRDFLETWEEDDREAVLAVTTPEFRTALSELPAPWLARLTQQVVSHSERRKSERNHKPQVAIDGDTSVVRLPRTDGTLQLSLKHGDGGWKVDDAAIRTRRAETEIRSVRNRARVIAAGTQFVDAFRLQDREKLKQLSTTTFFANALQDSDLTAAKLPDITLAPTDYEMKATVDHATLLVPTTTNVLKLEFARLADAAAGSEVQYRVKDVSVYGDDEESQVRLSALFTAGKQVTAFNEALLQGRVTSLAGLSTVDFDSRVWSKAEGVPLMLLPLGHAGERLQKIADTEFRGSVTRVRALHASGEATYVLRDADGKLKVDDILLGSGEKQRSVKEGLELSIPILSFAGAMETNQLRDVQRACSRDFNRLVWEQSTEVIRPDASVLRYLTMPIRRIRTQPGRAMVELGKADSGAVVSLIEENAYWVIDEVQLIAGVEPSQQLSLKEDLRHRLATGTHRTARPTALAAAESTSAIEPAAPRQQARKRFNLSLDQPAIATGSPTNEPPVQTVELTSGTQEKNGVDLAVLFAPMEPAAAPTPPPGMVDVPADASPVDPGAFDAPASADSPTAGDAPSLVGTPTTGIVPLNDTTRVADPAMHPILVPRD